MVNKLYLNNEGTVLGHTKVDNTYIFDAIGHRTNMGVMLNLIEMKLARLRRENNDDL